MLLLLLGCADDPFYVPPDLDHAAPGELLRVEEVGAVDAGTLSWAAGEAAPGGARVVRILYATVGLDGAVTAASARVGLPEAVAAPGRVAAVLHGTVGLADVCAPSREPGLGFQSDVNPHAAHLLATGRVVVAPDYLGLGTPGPHPYTAAGPTGTAVLDALRAVEALTDADGVALGPAADIQLVGHSQGAHAVLAALAAAPTYAPELPLSAAVALAAPPAPATLLGALAADDRWGGFIGLSLVGLAAAYPQLDVAALLAPGSTLPERAEAECLGSLGDTLDVPLDRVLAPELATAAREGRLPAAVAEVLAAEDLSALDTAVPVWWVHGEADPIFPVALAAATADAMGAAGANVTFEVVPDGDHLFLPWTAREAVWDRLR